MERFAGTEQRFSIDESKDAKTLYQRFAFLKSLLEDERFVSAIQLVLSRPFAAWRATTERRQTGWGVRTSSQLARQFSLPGPRVRVLTDAPQPSISLPRVLEVHRSEETTDNAPNRFVKFTLEKWRTEVLLVQRSLASEQQTMPVKRGLREVDSVLAQLNEYLSAPLFADVSHLRQIPSNNPVMIRKEGYRDIYSAHIQFEMAAQLAWSGGEEVYGAGQRNVAALYEYWVFLKVADLLSSLCDKPFDLSELLELQENGLNLVLARTRERALAGHVTRLGTVLDVQLWFNRTFSSDELAGSWTRPMRPDCSLLLRPAGCASSDYRQIWVHFDAKYRAKELRDLLGGTTDVSEPDSAPESSTRSEARRTDLLKMHAYRDAISRSAGAFVIYPGTEQEACRQYHELLPGLGAFGLRPTSTGAPDGVSALHSFLEDILAHAASQMSQHERGRYWAKESYKEVREGHFYSASAPFLSRPPVDSLLLLGYVKGSDHLSWIEKTGLYNLRADERRGSVGLGARELAVDFILLYGRTLPPQLWRVTGEPRILTAARMLASGYPRPRGELYFCLPVEADTSDYSPTLNQADVERVISALRPSVVSKAPVVVSWFDLLTT